jgi:hypothetical protein
MRKCLNLLAILAGIALIAGAAYARTVAISGTHSQTEIKATCDSVGGSYVENANVYGCVKTNCDGKGNDCKVACQKTNGTCKGDTPNRVISTSIEAILTGEPGPDSRGSPTAPLQ